LDGSLGFGLKKTYATKLIIDRKLTANNTSNEFKQKQQKKRV